MVDLLVDVDDLQETSFKNVRQNKPFKNLIIQEDPPTYTNHDFLFKQLIQTFFKEFMEAFFPDIYEDIDFSSTEFLSEEVFTDTVNGETRRLDIVVKVKLYDTDTLIIVHVEPQSYVQRDFNFRMYQYFNLLHNKYRLPIIPIAIFSYEEAWNEDTYISETKGFGLTGFRYATLHLRSKDWRKFLKQDNPVAGALLSKMDYSEEERVQVKLEFLRMLVRLQGNPAENRLLYGFFESYLSLSEEEEETLMKEASELKEAKEIFEIPISYEEKGKQIGREEGREEGREVGMEEGRLEERLAIALSLLKEGLAKDVIMKTTKLSVDQLKELEKQL